MRILYVATDQIVPGTKGGSTHVLAVAEGLAALGHEVHVLASPGGGAPSLGPVHWHSFGPPLGFRQLRFLRAGAVRALATSMRPDVIMERYYNFGGEGVRAAVALKLPLVLEVNAPVVDYEGSPKRVLDRALLVEPMRRWREWQCRVAALIVTPSASIVPNEVARERILEIEWGADTERFRPFAPGSHPFPRRTETIAVFAGAFRRWHGAIHLVEAIRTLRARGRTNISALMIGDGPEFGRVRRAAAGIEDSVLLMGAVDHDRVPGFLAAAHIGVAPFDVSAHAPLALDFYWSPLKVFEYMASGLPVVAPDIPRLRRIVADGREGLLYDAADPNGLVSALERLLDDDALRATLGAAARARVVREFGWDVHCRKLDEALRRCAS
jgi:glycosyltransferase involved in cell wall biosynthesis